MEGKDVLLEGRGRSLDGELIDLAGISIGKPLSSQSRIGRARKAVEKNWEQLRVKEVRYEWIWS